jgi:hypothetical protein
MAELARETAYPSIGSSTPETRPVGKVQNFQQCAKSRPSALAAPSNRLKSSRRTALRE